ncbi:ATP-binding protein [Nostoc sp. NMS4]|uniref:AAA family ATPase n=1 Tax=Nostoc sp. NMS4 TaxID=2815390 RepID=UPI0025F9EE31|nr:ATP-binding protein [Nostoc sp. NMS4]MBN3927277.1 AAA family ATPase [Nostoc sp. NMS4]
MLKQLILENWKSFRYAELPLDPLTVLIGTNASGKSNVVEALEFLQRIAIGENIEAALAGDKTLPSLRGGIEWAALKPETQFTLKALIQGKNENIDYLYSITVQTKPITHILMEDIIEPQNEINENNNKEDFDKKYISNKSLLPNIKKQLIPYYEVKDKINQTQSYINSEFTKIIDSSSLLKKLNDSDIENLKKLTNGESLIASVNENIQLLEDVKSKLIEHFNNRDKQIDSLVHPLLKEYDLVVDSLENIFVINPIPSKMRDYSSISDVLESDASNIAGVLTALPDERKVEVEATLSAYVKNLPEGDIKKVFAEAVAPLKTDAMLYCEEEWKPGETTIINAKTMSDGTLRFIAIITALLTRPEGSQLVIEEIDNGLHPSRAELLVKILREIGSKRKIDILLTTHNPALLDALGPEIVPFVVVAHRDKETGESKLTLLEDIENLPLLLASGTLGKLATKGAIEKSLSDNK